jgi:hypothetical protein
MVWRDRDAAGLVFANVHETSGVVPLEWRAGSAPANGPTSNCSRASISSGPNIDAIKQSR